MKSRLAAEGAGPAGGSPERFGAFMHADIEKWAKVIRTANAQTD